MAGGALFGAVAAVLAFVAASLLTDDFVMATEPVALLFAALCGAIVGAPLLPATGFLLLRRVPLGLSIAGTMVGTVVGGVVAAIVFGTSNPVIYPIVGAIIGFLIAAIVLRLRFESPRPSAAIRVPRSG